MARIRRDALEAQVVGVLYERRPPKTLLQRMGIWRKKMKRLVYWRYVLHRILAAVESRLSGLLDAVIGCVHAAPKWPNGKPSTNANRMPIISSLWPSTPRKKTLERSGSSKLASPLTRSGCAIAETLRLKKEIRIETDFSSL